MSDPLPPLALSLVVITRDAGASLAECLRSVAFASQTIVVDSGSGDDTAQIAASSGALVIEHALREAGIRPESELVSSVMVEVKRIREERADVLLTLDDARANQGTKVYLQMRDGPFQPEPFGPRSKKR